MSNEREALILEERRVLIKQIAKYAAVLDRIAHDDYLTADEKAALAKQALEEVAS